MCLNERPKNEVIPKLAPFRSENVRCNWKVALCDVTTGTNTYWVSDNTPSQASFTPLSKRGKVQQSFSFSRKLHPAVFLSVAKNRRLTFFFLHA